MESRTGTGTSTRGTDQRGTSAANRGIEDRSLSSTEAIPLTKQPGTTQDRIVYKSRESVANVWAHKIGDFSLYYAPKDSEWTHVFKIESLGDLLRELQDERLHGHINKLVIVAHGDLGGQVLLNPEINHKNIEQFSKQFTLLKNFLRPSGRLVFMSCEAGAGKDGTFFLSRVSSFLSGPHVIGFTIKGLIRARSAPGDVYEGRLTMTGMSGTHGKGAGRMTEDSAWSKWARNGKVIRMGLWGELSATKGLWDVTTAMVNDRVVSKYVGSQLTIESDYLKLAKRGRSFFEGRYKINLVNRPRTIDLAYSSGPSKGKTVAGIFEFGSEDYDSLTISLSGPSEKRPTDFTSAAKSNKLLLEMTRSPDKLAEY